jgi:hypothetical protein
MWSENQREEGVFATITSLPEVYGYTETKH